MDTRGGAARRRQEIARRAAVAQPMMSQGQGSPLSGEDHSTPATDTQNNGVGTTPEPVLDGKTAPSANSIH